MGQQNEIDDGQMRELTQQAFAKAIVAVGRHSDNDPVSRALLYLLMRVANSWRSIGVLWRECSETFLVDAGTLLRAMFDAYLQAAFVVQDRERREERAQLYLDFEHVEKHELLERILQHDTFVSSKLAMSLHREEGEARLKTQYSRVSDRYLTRKGNRTRRQWYRGTLRDLAIAVGVESEFELFVFAFHPYVHSSAYGVKTGPPIEPQHVLTLASVIAGRVAILSLTQIGERLDDPHQSLLEALADGPLDAPRTSA